ncbi:hypothetical protein BDC45DRAFT_122398 [Circinella umbellata]|nr:hypothetical protein BDC45DRAFT_122398 [Circinella umbellata]
MTLLLKNRLMKKKILIHSMSMYIYFIFGIFFYFYFAVMGSKSRVFWILGIYGCIYKEIKLNTHTHQPPCYSNSEQLVDPVFYNYHPQLSDFQLISQPDHGSDDNESTSSWEDIQQRIDMFDYGFDTDSTSDEEEEQEQIVLPKRRVVTREEKPKPKPKQQKKKDQIRKKQQKAEQQEQENIVPVNNGCAISQKKQSQEQSVESQQLDNHSLQHVQEQPLDDEGLERADPRPTAHPTIYQKLTKQNVDWCRYCGTTEGVNWRPGPWGKRTLCNKHGCDYKGYGFACKLPRLDLTGFANEAINDRDRPVLQLFCSVCHRQESWEGNVLVRCEGCPKAMHQKCCSQTLTDDFIKSDEQWFCDASCHENARRKRIVVELPRKRLPLMCAPKNNASTSNSNTTSSTSLRSSTSS